MPFGSGSLSMSSGMSLMSLGLTPSSRAIWRMNLLLAAGRSARPVMTQMDLRMAAEAAGEVGYRVAAL